MNRIKIRCGQRWSEDRIVRHCKFTSVRGTVIDTRNLHPTWKWRCDQHYKAITGGAKTFEKCLNRALYHHWLYHTLPGNLFRLKYRKAA